MRILYATDGSDQAAAAGRFLETLSLTAADSVRVVSVVPRPMLPNVTGVDLVTGAWETLAEVHVQERELAERAATEATSVLRSRQVETSAEVRDGDPASGILDAAVAWGADLILLGATGLSGLERLLLGSVARNVAKHSRLPVLVAREPQAGLARVVVATDGSEHALHAIAFTVRLPLPPAVELTAAHVVRPYAPFPGILPTDRPEFDAAVLEVNRQHRAAGERLVRDAASTLSAPGETATTAVREGDPAQELISLAEEQGADLIVAGARGASLLEGLLVGSVADRLLKDAPCSVLLVR